MSSEVDKGSGKTQNHMTYARLMQLTAGLSSLPKRLVILGLVILLLLILFCAALISAIDREYAQIAYSVPASFERQDISVTLVLTYPQYIYLGANSQEQWLISAQTIPNSGISTTQQSSYLVRFSSENDRLLFKDESGRIVPGQLTLVPSDPQARIGTLFVEPRPMKSDTLGRTIISITVIDSSQQDRYVGAIEVDIEKPWAFWRRILLRKLLEELSIPAGLILALVGWVIESNHRLKEQQEKEIAEAFNDVRKAIEEDPIHGLKELDLFLSDTRYGILEEHKRNDYKRKTVTPQFKERLVRRVNQYLLEGSSFEVDDPLLHALPNCQPMQSVVLTDLATVIEATVIEATVIDGEAKPGAVLREARRIWKQYNSDAREIVVQALVRVGEKELSQIDDWESKELELFQDKRLRNINIKTPPVSPHLTLWIWQRQQPPLDRGLSKWLEHQELRFNPFDLGAWTPRSLPKERQTPRPLLKSSWTLSKDWGTIIDSKPTIVCTASSSDTTAASHDRTAASVMASDSLLEQRKSFVVFWRPSSERLGADDETILRAVLRAIGDEWLRLLARHPQTFVQIADYEQVALTELLIWITGSFRQLEARLRQNDLEHTSDASDLLQRLQELSRPIIHGWTPAYERLITWLLVRPAFVAGTFLVVDTNYRQADDLAPMLDTLYDRDVMLKLFCDARTVNPNRYGTRVDLSWDDDALKKALSARIREASSQRFDQFEWLFADRSRDVDDRLVQQAQGSLGRLLQLGNAILDARLRRLSDPAEGLTHEDVEAALA